MKKCDWKILFFTAMMGAATPMFAQGVLPAGMNTLMSSILEVFTGDFVRIILVICLAGCAVAYGFNKDNEKMKRNIIAIGIAIGIVVGASAIVETVWKAAGGK